MEIDSDPDHPARRDETRAQDKAISVPMHEQLFYLVGFHYSYDFLEVNIFFPSSIQPFNTMNKFQCKIFISEFFERLL